MSDTALAARRKTRLVAASGVVFALLLVWPSRWLADRATAVFAARLTEVLGPTAKVGAITMSPLGLVVDRIESESVTVGRAMIRVAPWALLTGRVSIGAATFTEVHVTRGDIAARAASVALTRAGRGWRGLVQEGHAVGPAGMGTAEVRELSFELEGRTVRRVAFTGAVVEHPLLGRFDQLQGQLRGEWPQLRGRIAAPGIDATLETTDTERHMRIELTRRVLQPAVGRAVISEPPQVDGTIEISQSADPDDPSRALQVVLGLRLSGMVLRHRMLSARAVGPIELQLGGDLGLQTGPEGVVVASNALVLRHRELELRVEGRVDRARGRVVLRMPKLACGKLLDAVPSGFLSRLSGLPLSGDAAAALTIAGAWDKLTEAEVAIDLDFGCKTSNEAPLGDPTRLGPLGAMPPDGVIDPSMRPAKFAPLAVVPGTLIRALLESEDSRFFEHKGFDVPMLRRALAHDLVARRLVRGASTLSQQLVKNLYLSGERTVERKLEEAFLTWRLEATTPKNRILELYFNIVDFGEGQRGVAAASRHYFHKPTSELTLDDSADLIALLPAPSRGRDEKWKERVTLLRARLGLAKK